jgi:hypothetical protein
MYFCSALFADTAVYSLRPRQDLANFPLQNPLKLPKTLRIAPFYTGTYAVNTHQQGYFSIARLLDELTSDQGGRQVKIDVISVTSKARSQLRCGHCICAPCLPPVSKWMQVHLAEFIASGRPLHGLKHMASRGYHLSPVGPCLD